MSPSSTADLAPPQAVAPEHPLLPLWRALGGIGDPCQQACGYDLSILDLGIVNDVSAEDGRVTVSLTFTEPFCAFGFRIIQEIEDRLSGLAGVREVRVALDPFPLWEPSRLSDRARQLHAAHRLRFGPASGARAEALAAIPDPKTPRGSHHD